MSDKTVQEAVARELEWEPRVDAAHIGVSARDGSVTLTGEVESFSARIAAMAAAERVYGVRAVADELHVTLHGPHHREDPELAEAVARSLRWSTEVPETVFAEVERGFVTLRGQAEWMFQRYAAMRAVQDLRGVSGVANQIVVLSSRASPVDVAQHIRKALERTARVDAGQIEVTMLDGTAQLEGCVHSLFEKRVAAEAAASAPGVTHVDDRLVVEP